MDIEKTMQFILEQQANSAAKIQVIGERLEALTGVVHTLAENQVALTNGQRLLTEGQRLLLDGQRALTEEVRTLAGEIRGLSVDIKALIARLDAHIKGRGDGTPTT